MLRLFEQFETIVLEMYGETDNRKLVRKYGVLTGDNALESNNAFFDKANKNWQRKFQVYFNAPADTVESLRKLGINVRETKMPQSVAEQKYNVKLENIPYCFSNVEWFWRLVEYGYKLGLNESISYNWYLMKKYLREFKPSETFEINQIEAENPIFEAELLRV